MTGALAFGPIWVVLLVVNATVDSRQKRDNAHLCGFTQSAIVDTNKVATDNEKGEDRSVCSSSLPVDLCATNDLDCKRIPTTRAWDGDKGMGRPKHELYSIERSRYSAIQEAQSR